MSASRATRATRASRVDAPIATLIARDPVGVWPDTTLRAVSELLERDQIGAVLVRRGDDLAGILSERDLIRCIAEGADPDVDRVDDLMTFDPISLDSTTPVVAVARAMLDECVRHMPVTDSDRVIGIVSMRDVLRALVDELDGEPE